MNRTPAEVAELAARTSYGRLIALLGGATGDLALAEDALSDAFEQALTSWPLAGVPNNPQGWLLTVARNRQRDVWKSAHHRRSQSLEAALNASVDVGSTAEELDPDAIPDRRLMLLFVCAHPAIAPNVRTPLMLQTVLGFDSARIARAYAMPASTMQQRLVRAKRRIQQARIPFVVPDRSSMPERLPPVLEAIYGCHALTFRGDGEVVSMTGEARYLATTLATLLGNQPEAWSLASLLTLASAREAAATRKYRPLDAQDPATWDSNLIAEGEEFLRRASRPGEAPGRFQLEAAIQAVHCTRVRGRDTDWGALTTLYTALVAVAPSLGSRVAQAAVRGRVDSPAAGIELLQGLPPERERFQPYHAALAELLANAGRGPEARTEYLRAAELTDDLALTAFLLARADDLERVVATSPSP